MTDSKTSTYAAFKTPVAKATIAFIGSGVMGAPMAGHLQRAGHPITVHTRTQSRAAALVESGAHWAASVADAVQNAEIVYTMVGTPREVEEIYFGPKGILATAQPGSILIDSTTSDPMLALRIAEEATSRKLQALDAPVTGGQKGAIEAHLSIMVGGEQAAWDRGKEILAALGTPRYMGRSGNGQYAKLANQVAIAGTMMGVCESLRLAELTGLNPQTFLDAVSSGAASSWSLSHLAPRMLKRDFAPGFSIKHFIKDMKLAQETARRLGMSCPSLDQALKLYEDLSERGGSAYGTQALYWLYQAAAGENIEQK